MDKNEIRLKAYIRKRERYYANMDWDKTQNMLLREKIIRRNQTRYILHNMWRVITKELYNFIHI